MATDLCVKDIRGLKTGWLIDGPNDKTILFFIHGYPDTPETWDLQVKHFASNYQVVAPYARGARPSEASTSVKRYGLTAVSLDHLEILQAVDPTKARKVVIVGHDIGGPQAWRLAPLLGERLAGLVIVNSLSIEQMAQRLMRSPSQQRKSWYIAAFLSGFVRERWIKKNPGRLLIKAHDKGQLTPKLRPSMAKAVSGVVHPVNHYRAYLPDILRSYYRPPVLVDKPVLVLWGNKDPFLDLIHKDEMRRVCRDATIRILEGSHWLHREQAEMVNQIMDEFICSLSNH